MSASDAKALKSGQLSARETSRRSDEVLAHMIGRAPEPHIIHRPGSAKTGTKAADRRPKRAGVRRPKHAPAS